MATMVVWRLKSEDVGELLEGADGAGDVEAVDAVESREAAL